MAYLTYDEYLKKFGAQETRMLTNETANGQDPDSVKVNEAIDDATDLVESYIGAKYVVPIASPPRLVEGWTAALAREALYTITGSVPDAVKDAADRTRKQLLDVQAGRMTLPIPEGGTPLEPTNSLGSASSSGDRDPSVFSGTGALNGFMSPFLAGEDIPCWRRGS